MRHHKLHFNTYRQQVACSHCKELLLGTYRQGLHCADCDNNFHKKCALLIFTCSSCPGTPAEKANGTQDDPERSVCGSQEMTSSPLQKNERRESAGEAHTLLPIPLKKITEGNLPCSYCSYHINNEGQQCAKCESHFHFRCAPLAPQCMGASNRPVDASIGLEKALPGNSATYSSHSSNSMGSISAVTSASGLPRRPTQGIGNRPQSYESIPERSMSMGGNTAAGKEPVTPQLTDKSIPEMNRNNFQPRPYEDVDEADLIGPGALEQEHSEYANVDAIRAAMAQENTERSPLPVSQNQISGGSPDAHVPTEQVNAEYIDAPLPGASMNDIPPTNQTNQTRKSLPSDPPMVPPRRGSSSRPNSQPSAPITLIAQSEIQPTNYVPQSVVITPTAPIAPPRPQGSLQRRATDGNITTPRHTSNVVGGREDTQEQGRWGSSEAFMCRPALQGTTPSTPTNSVAASDTFPPNPPPRAPPRPVPRPTSDSSQPVYTDIRENLVRRAATVSSVRTPGSDSEFPHPQGGSIASPTPTPPPMTDWRQAIAAISGVGATVGAAGMVAGAVGSPVTPSTPPVAAAAEGGPLMYDKIASASPRTINDLHGAWALAAMERFPGVSYDDLRATSILGLDTPDIETAPFFHPMDPTLTQADRRAKLDHMLQDKPDGTWLVRKSRDQYVLTVRYDFRTRHVLMETNGTQYFVVVGEKFRSPLQLLAYYTRNILSTAVPCPLRHPLTPSGSVATLPVNSPEASTMSFFPQ